MLHNPPRPSVDLALHAHLACVGPDLVLLDEQDDQYGCWIGAADGLSMTGRRIQSADAHLLDDLAALGCLERDDGAPTEGQRQAHRTAPPAASDDLAAARPNPTARDRVDFALTALQMLAVYPGRGLPHLLRAARLRPPGLLQRHDAARLRSAQFRHWLPWAPFQGRCLYRALFLLLFLRRGRLDADWVFGVRTWPFSAHCWLQVGDLVLADDLDRVQAYTPILVV